MAETLTFKHKTGASGKIDYRTKEVRFGDGYTQVARDGINNRIEQWPLTFEGNEAEMQEVMDFFDRHAGAASFLWTPPGSKGVAKLFRCKTFSMTRTGGLYSVSAELVQHFTP